MSQTRSERCRRPSHRLRTALIFAGVTASLGGAAAADAAGTASLRGIYSTDTAGQASGIGGPLYPAGVGIEIRVSPSATKAYVETWCARRSTSNLAAIWAWTTLSASLKHDRSFAVDERALPPYAQRGLPAESPGPIERQYSARADRRACDPFRSSLVCGRPIGRSRRRRDDGRAPAARRRWLGAGRSSASVIWRGGAVSTSARPAHGGRSRSDACRAAASHRRPRGESVQLPRSTRRLSSPGRPLTKIACVAA